MRTGPVTLACKDRRPFTGTINLVAWLPVGIQIGNIVRIAIQNIHPGAFVAHRQAHGRRKWNSSVVAAILHRRGTGVEPNPIPIGHAVDIVLIDQFIGCLGLASVTIGFIAVSGNGQSITV